MALYRNIAGFNDDGRIGLSLYSTPSLTFIDSGTSLPSPFTDPAAYQEQQQAVQEATITEMNARYDWLMSHTFDEVTAAGYYVTTDNGSIFQWVDVSHTTSTAYLPLQEIQRIENERGTAGSLLMHLQQPEIAKDTAGFEGGGSATFYQEAGVDPETRVVTDPIPDVQTLSPVSTTTATTSTTTQPGLPVATPKNNFLPLALAAGLAAVALVGEPLLKKRRKLVFLGGVGALFYANAVGPGPFFYRIGVRE